MRYLTVLVLSGIALAGCKTDLDRVDEKYIMKHPVPELQTLAERPSDVSRNLATMRNQNWRMWWEDWGRAFYADHPSRMTGMPVTYTGGQPR